MAKFDKTEFANYVRAHPKATYREIGEHFGCTHQHAQHLAVKLVLRKQILFRSTFTDDDLRKFFAVEGRTREDAARHFHASSRTISRAVARVGIVLQEQKRVDRTALLAYFRENPGISIAEIADHFDFAESTISEYLVRMGLHKTKQGQIIDDKKLANFLKNHPYVSRAEMAEKFGCSRAAISAAKVRISRPKNKKPPKPPKFVSWEAYEKVLAVEPDISVVDLAARLGLGTTTVNRALRRHGWHRGHKRKIDVDEFCKMFDDGCSVYEMADRFGVVTSALYAIGKRLGKMFSDRKMKKKG